MLSGDVLRTSGQRQCRHTTDQRNEFAPSHLAVPQLPQRPTLSPRRAPVLLAPPPSPLMAITITAFEIRSWLAPRRRIWVRRSHGDQRIFLRARLELADHLQYRAEDPAIGNLLVLLLPRVGVEVEQQRYRELDGRRDHRLLLVEMDLEILPFHRLQAIRTPDQDSIAPRLLRLAGEEVRLVDAVDWPVFRQLGAGQFRQRGKEIDGMDDLVAHASGRHL